jgi:hypothetical protein
MSGGVAQRLHCAVAGDDAGFGSADAISGSSSQEPKELHMNLKKTAASLAIAGACGFGALGFGLGTASADPGGHGGPPCWGPYCQNDQRGEGDGGNRGDGPRFDQYRWDQRNIDEGRYDHQPFNYQGYRAEPYFDNGRGVWGFWFFGIFVPL